MARKSKADRINEIIKFNPVLKRDDARINDLILAEAQLRKAQSAARNSSVTTQSASGSEKRAPALVALEQAEKSVRRLRNELELDRLGVKRNEQVGIKSKRSNQFSNILEKFGPTFAIDAQLLPGHAAFLNAHGIEAEDMPTEHQELFRSSLDKSAGLVAGIRERLKIARMY